MKSDFKTPREGVFSLADLGPGESAAVREVATGDAIGRRLMDLGLLPGTAVRAIRRSPLGDPTVYELRGYRLCLRRVDAARVRVGTEPLPGVPDASTV